MEKTTVPLSQTVVCGEDRLVHLDYPARSVVVMMLVPSWACIPVCPFTVFETFLARPLIREILKEIEITPEQYIKHLERR